MAAQSKYAHRKQGRKPPNMGKRIVVAIEVLLGFAFVGAIGYYFYQYTVVSDKFQVKQVEIEGLRTLSEDAILEASGLIDDGNVLYLDVGAVVESVEALAYVKSCDVKQVFPDTVVISIEERIPHLTLQLNSRAYAIDESGVVLHEYGPVEETLLPFITNVGGVEFVEPGEALGAEGLDAALEVWETFRALPMAEGLHVSELAAYSGDEVLMYCDELVFEIRWGQGDIAKQGKRLGVIWDQQNGAIPCGEYLDLRFGEDLICK